LATSLPSSVEKKDVLFSKGWKNRIESFQPLEKSRERVPGFGKEREKGEDG